MSKPGIFSKLGKYIEAGKQKIKDKLKKNDFTNHNNLSAQSTNQSNDSQNKNQSQKTNSTSKNKEEDIFKIEEEDGGEVNKYVIRDVYSDEESEEEESENNKEEKTKPMEDNISNEKNEKERKEPYSVVTFQSISKDYDSVQDDLFQQEKIDEYKICHYLRMKGTIIDVSNEFVIPCKRIKDKNKLIKFLGLNTSKIEVDYLCYFDENYFYPIKNNALFEDVNLRRMGNKYDLRQIYNISLRVSLFK